MDLNNQRHAIITGASSGLGLETAKLFANTGSKLSLICRKERKIKKHHYFTRFIFSCQYDYGFVYWLGLHVHRQLAPQSSLEMLAVGFSWEVKL